MNISNATAHLLQELLNDILYGDDAQRSALWHFGEVGLRRRGARSSLRMTPMLTKHPHGHFTMKRNYPV